MALDAECHKPISTYPKILKDIELWDMEYSKEMDQILEIIVMRPISGAGPIILIRDQNVELTTGFTSFESYIDGKNYEIIKELNLKLWKSLLERITKNGVT